MPQEETLRVSLKPEGSSKEGLLIVFTFHQGQCCGRQTVSVATVGRGHAQGAHKSLG